MKIDQLKLNWSLVDFYVKYKDSRLSVIKELLKIKNVDEVIVTGVWLTQNVFNDPYLNRDIAIFAATHGELEALRALRSYLGDPESLKGRKVYPIAIELTGYEGKLEDFDGWFNENIDRLLFDHRIKRFIIRD